MTRPLFLCHFLVKTMTEKELLRVALDELEMYRLLARRQQSYLDRQRKQIEFLLSEVKRLKEGRDI